MVVNMIRKFDFLLFRFSFFIDLCQKDGYKFPEININFKFKLKVKRKIIIDKKRKIQFIVVMQYIFFYTRSKMIKYF